MELFQFFNLRDAQQSELMYLTKLREETYQRHLREKEGMKSIVIDIKRDAEQWLLDNPGKTKEDNEFKNVFDEWAKQVKGEWLGLLSFKERNEYNAIEDRILTIEYELSGKSDPRKAAKEWQYLEEQNNEHSDKMFHLEHDRNSHTRRRLAPILEEEVEVTQEGKVELKRVREESATERWIAHAAWEVRRYGYVCSNEDAWKQRFIVEGLVRPARAKSSFKMVSPTI